MGLAFGSAAPGVYYDDTSVVVKAEVAEDHLQKVVVKGNGDRTQGDEPPSEPNRSKEDGLPEQELHVPTRFYGTVKLNPSRIGGDAGTVGEEVLQHLAALLDSDVEVTLEIEVKTPDGFPDTVVRTVTENARTLKFDNFGFEEE